MQAFHNNPTVKTEYIARVQGHIDADDLVRGATGQNGKGCAVWCTMNVYEHKQYEPAIGIPEWLARVEDVLFEGMSLDKSRTWPRDFLEAAHVGADLNKIKGSFLVFVLREALKTFDHAKHPAVVEAINGSIALWQREDVESVDWNKAAWAAAKAAAAEAAKAAEASEAAWAAAKVAEAAWAAEAAALAAWAAAKVEYDLFADELLRLMRECQA